MKYIEAFSTEHESIYQPKAGEFSLFLGGGISACADWQADVARLLQKTDIVVINPRRKNFPMDDPLEAGRQIEWEFEHLRKANMLMFWFAPETLCPITLFEYGKWLVQNKPLFVGCDPHYKRANDVKIQTALERPFQKVFDSVDEVIGSILLHSMYWR